MLDEVRLEFGDTESTIDEFKQRIGQAVGKDRDKLKKLAEQESASIITRAQEEAGNIVTQAKRQANDEVERIIAEARKEADKLAETITEEVREEAKRESAEIIADAKQTAEQLVSEAKANAQREQDQLIASITSEIRQKAESDAAQVLSEAKEKAQKLITETTSKVCAALVESGRIGMEAQQKLEQAIEALEEEFKETKYEKKVISVPTTFNKGSEDSVASNIESETCILPTREDDEQLYEGKMEIRIVPPAGSAQIRNFEQHLPQISHLRLIATGGSSKGGNWFAVELHEPIPVLKLIKGIPSVKEAVCYRGVIGVALKSK